MTFTRSLTISIVSHLLIFGATIAVAQFAAGSLRGQRNVLTVSLVGSGRGAAGSITRGESDNEIKSQQRSVTPRAASHDVRREFPGKDRSEHHETSAEDPQKIIKDAGESGGDEARKGQKGDGSDGSGPGAQFGLVSAEQWAVIQAALERSKTYPRLARERGIQGVVRVRFKVRTSGEVGTVEIVKSSGYDILDSATVRTVYRAAPLPHVNGWVEVPISYVIQ